MTHRSRQSFALFAILLLIAFMPGCDSLKGPEGPSGPVLTGDIVGYAYLFDLTGARATDQSGITVTVEGTDISAVTGVDGRWVLSNLTTGTYTLAFSKPGYGTAKSPAYQFVGGGQAWYGTKNIYQTPPYPPEGFGITAVAGDITVYGTLGGPLPNSNRGVRFFFGDSISVSSAPASYRYTCSLSIPSTSTTYSITVSGSTLRSYGFSSGLRVLVVAYGENAYGSFGYLDLSTGKQCYPNLSPGKIGPVGATMP